MQKHPDSLRIQTPKLSSSMAMGTVFSKAVTSNHLLSLILKEALELARAEVCIIWLKNSSGALIPRMSFGLKSAMIPSMAKRLGSGLVKKIMARSEPTAIYDMLGDGRVAVKRLIKSEGLKSMLACPMTVAGEKTGVLMVCTKEPRRFTEVDLRVFAVLARQSALAVANVGLFDMASRKIKEKSKEMSLLFTMSRSLSSAVSMNTVLAVILEKARILLKARFCVLRVYEASRRNLSVVSFAGLSDAKAGLLAGFEEDLAQKVLHSGITCVINDLNAHFNGKVPAYLKKNRIKSLIITPLFSAKRRAGVLSMYIPEARFFDKEEISMFEMISSLCSVAIDNSVMLERIRRDYLNMVKTLAKIIDTNDPYTRGHCDKVMKYSLAICRKMRLKNRDLNAVKTASLLHDIGKIGVDLSVIRKSGKLSGEDWESIKTHPDIGARIVAQVGFLNDIVPIIRHHHERYGGGGYPDPKKKREKIPLGARIIAVADAFDAMTSDRPYRKAMTRDRAVRELKACAGSQFDPEVVKAFIG